MHKDIARKFLSVNYVDSEGARKGKRQGEAVRSSSTLSHPWLCQEPPHYRIHRLGRSVSYPVFFFFFTVSVASFP